MRLIVMRHAKSDWSSAAETDHARPLNERGQRSARALGKWLRSRDFLPDMALISTAVRTRQTFDLLALRAAGQYSSQMYLAQPQVLFDMVSNAQGQVVLILGHNPGIAEFAAQILKAPPHHPRFQDFPTGATLVADILCDTWDAVAPGCARASAFVTPRDLS
ncbi:MAG: histidine phosphatase family protein [Rhodobacteraceae bacterium]|nr:histidine phosphatase family protein [Paracoccaceae bacterium]